MKTLDDKLLADLAKAKKGDTEAQMRMKSRGWSAVDMILHGIERLDDCLEEFKDFLGLARDMKELTNTVGELIGADGTSEIGGFTWVDDGKRDKNVTIQTIIEKQNNNLSGGR